MISLIRKNTDGKAVEREFSVTNKLQGDEIVVAMEATQNERVLLREQFKLKPGNLNDVFDADEMSRIDHDAKYEYLYLRRAFLDAKNQITIRPILLIFGGENLLTVFPDKTDFLKNIFSEIDNLSTSSQEEILLAILTKIFDDYARLIERQNHAIRKITKKMSARRLENQDFVNFVILEDQINSFLSALMPVVPLLRRIPTSQHISLDQLESDALEDQMLAVEQLIDLCQANAARIISIREAYATLTNNSLNKTMKTLTLATLLFAAPNMIFGMYGMNVYLPFQWENWGFWFSLSLAFLLIIVVIFWARHRRIF